MSSRLHDEDDGDVELVERNVKGDEEGGGEDENLTSPEKDETVQDHADGDNVVDEIDEDEENDVKVLEHNSLKLNLKYRCFNKTTITVTFLWHLIPIITMVYAFLYIGCVWNPAAHTKNITILILNQDQGFNFSSSAFAGSGLIDNSTLALLQTLPAPTAGDLLVQELLTNSQTANVFDWKVESPGLMTKQSLTDCIDDGCAWGALYIPPNFSSTMFAAFGPTINVTQLQQHLFFSSGAYGTYVNPVDFIYDQGRNYATLTIVVTIMQQIFLAVSQGISQQIFSSNIGPVLLQYVNPAFIMSPVSLQLVNLHPVAVYGLNFATYIVFVLAWIGSTMTVTAIYTAISTTESDKIKMDLGLLASIRGVRNLSQRGKFMVVAAWNQILRGIWGLVFNIGLSFLLTVVIAAVASDSSEHVFHDNFIAYWMWLLYVCICFIFFQMVLVGIFGISAFQLASTFLLILQLTSGGALMSEDLMNRFYLIGRGFPFYYAVRGARTIMFGSLANKMEENALIIFGWSLACLVLGFFLSLLRMEKRWVSWQKNEHVGRIIQATAGANATSYLVPG